MNVIITWLCLITAGQYTHGKVISISNSGNGSTLCCTNGACQCNSLYTALSSIESNTTINITSQAVFLNTPVFIRPGNLIKNNITITSSVGAIVMCNNIGLVYYGGFSNITIEGITWDQCGHINYPNMAGITFVVVSNVFITNCTFQQSKVCASVNITQPLGLISVVNSKFMFNTVPNALLSQCSKNGCRSSLLVKSYGSTEVIIRDSLFYHNGNAEYEIQDVLNGSFLYFGPQYQPSQSILVKNTSFISNGIRSMLIHDTAVSSKIIVEGVNISNNRYGASVRMLGEGNTNLLSVISSRFVCSGNGALLIQLGNNNNVKVHNTTFADNIGSADIHGIALHITGGISLINISLCNFNDNIGGNSIVYVNVALEDYFPSIYCNVSITSSDFMKNKIGSPLQIANCFLNFYSTTLFKDNSARSGAAVYIALTSQITMHDGSTVQFINNTASLRGGAMYIDLTNCYDRGIVFTNFTRYDAISFVNNSAKLSGNSIYFNIPVSCDVIRDHTKTDSAAYVPYKFNYTQRDNINGPAISTSPYQINLCSSAKHDSINNTSKCVIKNDVMLGQSVYFDTAIYDHFNAVAEATQFKVNCLNCGSKYRLLEIKILVQNRSRGRINMLSVSADRDLENGTNITFNILSNFSSEYNEISATLLLTLSSCNNGYLFSKISQRCECYSKDVYLYCEGDSASIKLGYWFGVFSGKYILSLCNNNYCNFFTHRKETMNGFYNLPEEIDDQCSYHRTGVACGECSEGYTLAYNSPDCISVDKCSPGMTVLVVVLTALYWVAIVAMLFGVSYYLNIRKVSLGYLYGMIYFYSIVDILLVTNLHKIDGVFYVTTILSSFAKLNPQFLGKLCFAKNLNAIDQQFIHYCHIVPISIVVIGIYVIAKCNDRAHSYVSHFIVHVTCLVLLFSYTSVTSTSFLLLRAVKFDDIDGSYTYLSPHLKYYAEQHAVYASVAIFCVLLVTIGFPLLLVIEPLIMKVFALCSNKKAWKKATLRIKFFIKKLNCFVRIKLLLDQLQDCYKDQYRWFAAYYLICRLVIMLITYFANDDYDNMIYYLQTTCVVITMTHIWIQPYKNDILNVMDAIILLITLLVVNLSAFSFSTSTIEGIAISLISAPWLLMFAVEVMKLFKFKRFQPKDDTNSDVVFIPR